MIILGVDPGLSGGLARLTQLRVPDGLEWELVTRPMPEDLRAFADWLAGVRHCFIEKAQSFPGQGIASAFNYGVHFGQLLGMLMAVPHTLVGPRAWTRELHAGTKAADPKARSLEAARRLFPLHKFLASDKCKRAHDGMIDAALLAEYGRRKLMGAGL